MDLSAVIVVVVMTALSLGTLVGLEIYSRKRHQKAGASDEANVDFED